MKKALTLILTITIACSLAACSNRQNDNDAAEEQTTITTTAATTTTAPATSTTAVPKEDSSKASQLKKAVQTALGSKEGSEITGDLNHGSFTYKYVREPETMYANERTEEAEKKAQKNAQRLVDEIKSIYPDEITFDRLYAAPIGSGDNGIDSVQYQFFYLNTQNQQLRIFADSDSEISFVECNFTW